MKNNKKDNDYNRVREVIMSCKTPDQLKVAVRMYNQLNKLHTLPDSDLNKLENLIGLMRIKCGVESMDENHTKDSSIKGLRFEGEKAIKEKSVESIAKKHGVSVKLIEKELRIGTKIESEHTSSKEKAKKIALDHISEIHDYYTDPSYGILAIEKKQGLGKKTIRISKKDMDRLHKDGKITIDGIELNYKGDVSEDMDMNRITQDRRSQEKRENEKRVSKSDMFDKIREKRKEKLTNREMMSFEDEELEEATGAVSSGSFVGPMNSPIKRPFNSSNVGLPQNKLNKPINKVFTYDGETPKMLEEDVISYCDKCDRLSDYCVCDDEMVDEATGASANATYDTSAWGKSKFMLTDKGPGKVRVKTEQPNNSNLGYTKVRVKDKCKKFPYCNQGAGAIETYSESRVFKKSDLKIKKHNNK